jgi:uncharacterized membrane protein
MEKKIAKKLLIKTIIVAILIFIITWFLGNYIYPFAMETKNLFAIVVSGLIGTVLLFCLYFCYLFAKEYIYILRKKND